MFVWTVEYRASKGLCLKGLVVWYLVTMHVCQDHG